MAPNGAVQLSAHQQETALDKDASISGVADMLLAALRAPVKLVWEADLEDQGAGAKARVKVSVDLSTNSSDWPPKKFTVSVIPANPADQEMSMLSTCGLEVSSSIATSQLAELLRVGSSNMSVCPADTEVLTDSAEAVSMNDSMTGQNKATETRVPVESSKPTLGVSLLASLPLVDSDKGTTVVQPVCLRQWHGNTCGHHALFSIQCLLNGQPGMLQNHQYFWQSTLRNIETLARYGETSGSWPPSRVTKGVVDEVHLRHLIQSCAALQGRVSIAQTADSFNTQLNECGSSMRVALDDVLCGRSQGHGFLLGATNHWYAAVVIAAESSHMVSSGSPAPVRLFFCDSYNRSLVHLQTDRDVEEMTEKLVDEGRKHFMAKLRLQPEWEHRPQEHLDSAFEEGLTEWWKGITKAGLFWREPPFEVKAQLKKQELENVRSYLSSLTLALGLSTHHINAE